MKQIHYSLTNAIICITLILFFLTSHLYSRGNNDNKGYRAATNSGLPDNIFIKKWLVLGPIEIKDIEPGQMDDATLKKHSIRIFLLRSQSIKMKALNRLILAGKKYTWKIFFIGMYL
jgi:hypothetical protein